MRNFGLGIRHHKIKKGLCLGSRCHESMAGLISAGTSNSQSCYWREI